MTDYFEFYNIPVAFHPDLIIVKHRFYALSKQYHPDFFATKSMEEQDEALAMSTQNNKAFQLLSDEKARLPYVLKLKGALIEGEQYQLPNDFLFEMMEVNEEIMELQFEADPVKKELIQGKVQTIESELNSKLNQLTKRFDAGAGDEGPQLLLQIKDLFYRSKYLYRMKENLTANQG